MRSLFLALAVAVVVVGAVAFSRTGEKDALGIKSEGRNPWTNLRLNNDPQSFQFAIVSDRTGSHRAKVFSQAVQRLNLLQPEFVMSVGDLIEGGRKSPKRLAAEWDEFNGYVKQLQMPFFYVPGNHDVSAKEADAEWRQRFGRRWYHFVYRNVLFLCLNSDDGERVGPGRLSKEQVDYAKNALANNADVRWTVVFVHKPMWTAADQTNRGWLDVEKSLAGRPYTVFCGHVHRYERYVRQGQVYYQLATTGGGSKMRGVEYGEFDHIVWVTMKKEGPVLANILLDSVLPDDLKVPDSSETGTPIDMKKTHPVRGYVYLDGVPVVDAQVTLRLIGGAKTKAKVTPMGVTEGDGSFRPTTYTNFDGMPAGKYSVTVVKGGAKKGGKARENLLPEKYGSFATTDLEVEIKEGGGEVRIDLKR